MRFVNVYLVILILMIPILGALTYWQFRDFAKEIRNLEAPGIETPKTGSIEEMRETIAGGFEDKNFEDSYGRIKLKYDASWTEVDSNILESAGKEAGASGEEILLFLYKIDAAKAEPSYFLVERTDYDNWNDIIRSIQNDIGSKGQTMEIVDSGIGDTEGFLEIKYGNRAGAGTAYSFFSRIKGIIDGNKSYLAMVIGTEEQWPGMKAETEKIMDSFELTGRTKNIEGAE